MDAVVFWGVITFERAAGNRMIRKFVFVLFFVSFSPAIVLPSATARQTSYLNSSLAEKYIRTELYFGFSKPNGSMVSESDWQRFVDEFVTPRFPDGLTILEADGQWRGKDLKVVREQSKVIVLLYKRKERKDANRKIEEVRSEYMKRFDQEAVMRVDIARSVSVTF